MLVKKAKKIAFLRGQTAAEYGEERFGPIVEADWESLPKDVRDFLEKHLDD